MNSHVQPASKRRFILIRMIVAVAAILPAVVLFTIRPSNLPNQLTWLSPTEFAQPKRVGPLTRLKFQLMRWTTPIWKSYWQNQPQISINARTFELSSATTWLTNLSAPFAVATNGTRAWILSSAQLPWVQKQIPCLPDFAVTGEERIIIADECSAQILGVPVGSDSNVLSAGLSLYVEPKIAKDKIVLTFNISDTGIETNITSGFSRIFTYQAYACRAVFPNNGGLLIVNPNPEPGDSNSRWLFLSARRWMPTVP